MIAIVLLLCLLATAANAISASELVGTWTTKSRSVVTGPVSDKVCFQEEMQADNGQRFFDPVDDRLLEPKHTGISYSFTENGFYEAAYYRAVANREYIYISVDRSIYHNAHTA